MASISDIIRGDLARTEATYRQTITARPEDRDPGEFVGELMRHLIAEELVITPVLEARLAESEEARDRIRKDYKSVGLFFLLPRASDSFTAQLTVGDKDKGEVATAVGFPPR